MGPSKRAARSTQTPRNPIRTCLACRETGFKKDLTRLVRTQKDGIKIDPTGKLPGRGAYLHTRRECWLIVLGEDERVARALRTKFTHADRRCLSDFAANLLDRGEEVKHD